ncbi:hypothetical protein [Dyadobacter sandarakinus]|uniref:Secreted protein n=1 Tax=Dyadobacter sandarakinus TaxID=2747268 RepID=A0ABX7ID22_9BACT|nr:hypothetical protein [Dyadobacter sandarakinus]QRR03598.1 hypothetical protein HWI92_23115 [Dyadobacter sandarakinus]
MFRKLCLILLTTFLICKATDVISLFQFREKASVVCESGTCDNEESAEAEKMGDDQMITSVSVHFGRSCLTILLRNTFSHPVTFHSEIYRNLYSPPPERA